MSLRCLRRGDDGHGQHYYDPLRPDLVRPGPDPRCVARVAVVPGLMAARLRALEADPRGADLGHLDRRVDDLRRRCRRQANPRPYSADAPPAANLS